MRKGRMWKTAVSVAMAAVLGVSLITPFVISEKVQAAESVENISEEREISFNKGWKFFLETDGSIDASGKEYDDSAWRDVDLPHDYSIEQDFDPNSPGTANGGYLNGGTGWYRKHFVLPKEMEGKRISISFGGVYMDSTVYINGRMVGNYPYGYSPFAYDITDYVTADGVTENVISVKVNHQQPSSRWYSGSGIYRNVDLVVADPVHVARYGTYVTTPDLEDEYAKGRAKVHVETKVENETESEAGVKVRTTILDDAGNVFCEAVTTEEIAVSAGETETFSQDIVTGKPELWDTETPDLYSVKTEVIVKDKVVDTYDSSLGFRWVTMDPDEGFYLNSEYMKLHGVCMHHDQGALGAVANYRAIERQMQSLKEMGVNAIRVTHNPAADELLEICNKEGLLVIDEAFDCWESAKRSKDYARFFSQTATHPDAEPGETWAEFDIKNMVDRGKNEPCIIMWSIGNEIVYATVDTAQNLVDWVKEVDDTRPATQGFNNFIDGFWDSGMKQVADVTGVVGFNYGEKSYDAAHEEYPDWLIMGSETSSAVRSRGYYIKDDEKKIRSSYDDGDTVGWGLSAEDAWKADRDRKFVLGEFVWTGYDYIGEPSPYHDQWPAKSSYFGVFDTAGIPKDAFYIYQSQWVDVDEHPMVHLLPHWNWEDDDSIKTDGKIRVQAYSNAASVELFLNGESLGKKEFLQLETSDGRPYQEAEDGHIYLEWEVEYKPGRLEAVARDTDGNEIARDVVETTGDPAKVELTPDRQVITADGYDLSYITVDIMDADGRVVPTASNQVNFQISGNGRIVGVDNGDATEVTDSYKGNTRKAYSGKAMVIVQSTEQEGSFTLTASSGGLESAKTTVFTVEDTEDKKLAGYETLSDIKTERGVLPELPDKVTAVYSDGTMEERAVIWDEIDEEQLSTPGIFYLEGIVDGTDDIVKVRIIVTDVVGIRDTAVVTQIGVIPELPEEVTAVYNTGLEKQVKVTWEAVSEGMVSEEGSVTIEGTVEGLSCKAKANIRVAEGETTFSRDIAKRSGTYPIPTASFEQANGNDPVEAVNNGKVYYSAGPAGERWIPWGHGEQNEWLQLEFEEEHYIGKVGLDFWTNPADTAMGTADRITVEYSLDGAAWIPVENQSISVKDEFVTDAENVIEFTPVNARFIRWNFYSEAGLAPGISEVHVYEGEAELPVNSDASLKDLKIDGVTVEGFSPEQYYYTAELDYEDEIPEITAEGADYASVFVVQALDGDSAALISSVAEDGVTRCDYTVQFTRALPKLKEAAIWIENTELTQDEIKDIQIEAVLQDGTVLSDDLIQVEYILGDPGVAEIHDGQIYALYPGTTTLMASVTYQGVTVETNVLDITIKENTEVSVITGYEEVHVTTEKGVVPVLPTAIRATFKEGLPKNVPVVWESVTVEQCMEYGEFVVKGTVEGQELQPEAVVLVKGVTGVQQFSTAVPVGTVPQLSDKARLYYSDGTTGEAQIQWEPHPQELFMEDGKIVAVKGTAQESGTDNIYETQATVRITSDTYKGDKFTGYKNGFYWPLGITSFTNKAGSSGDSPSKLNDNIVSRIPEDNNRWTNWSDSWRESDWAGIIFGLEEVTYKFIDHLEVDFYTDYGAALPEEIEVQYYAGEYFNVPPSDPGQVTEDHPAGKDENWKSVNNLKIPEELSTEETNVLTFDPVETCAIRIVMRAEDGKCLAITEIASYEKLAEIKDTAELENIFINGEPLEGFDKDNETYTVTTPDIPEITAKASENGAVTVVMPDKFGDRAQIIVTAEDGVQTKSYHVKIEQGDEQQKPGKTTLEYFLDRAKVYLENGDVDGCVESVQKMFVEAVSEGEAVMADENATREEVLNAAMKLMKAIHALDMKAADKTDLEMAVELAEMIDLMNYVDAGQKEFTDALAAAKEVLSDGDALQGDADEAWDALVGAMENLRLNADKDALEDILNEVEDLDLSLYTEKSSAVFRTALANAQAVMADETLTEEDQKTVDEAVQALIDAKEQLRLKDGSGGEEDFDSDNNSVESADVPKTGDTRKWILLVGIMLVSAGAVSVLRKKSM